MRSTMNWMVATATLAMMLAVPSAMAQGDNAAANASAGYRWSPLTIGAGGFITGIDVNRSGKVIYARADTGGAFRLRRDQPGAQWEQIVTDRSLPTDAIEPFFYEGVTSILSAPSNDRRVYMVWPDGRGNASVYRSDDGADSWTRTGLTLDLEGQGPNGNGRQAGERLAIDPVNPDIVYYGSLGRGLFVSTDAGRNWSKVDTVSLSGEVEFGTGNVHYDAAGPVRNGKSQIIYASVHNIGIFRSTDGGVRWQNLRNLAGTVPPAGRVQHIETDHRGRLFAAVDEQLYRLDGNDWRQLPLPQDMTAVAMAINPLRHGEIMIFGHGGGSVRSVDGGDTFSAIVPAHRQSSDIPWLLFTDEHHFSMATVQFDPSDNASVWTAQGIGIWTAKVAGDGPIEWQGRSSGIEQLVPNVIVAPPGGKPVSGSWDRAFFRHEDPDAFPLRHGPTARFNSGWDLSFAAANPNVIAGVAFDHRQCCSRWIGSDNQSGLSRDGGRSWTPFPAIVDGTLPTDLKFGNIAIAARDTNNLVWLPTADKPAYATQDGGQSWTPITLQMPDGEVVTPAGSHHMPYLFRHALAADTILDRTFYIFHSGSHRLFRSEDGGTSWQSESGPTAAGSVGGGSLRGFYDHSSKLRSMPGLSRHLCLADGGSQPLYCTSDAGARWQLVAGTSRVYNFAFGKAAPGRSVPTLYIQGFVNNRPGIWCSIDMGQNWGQLSRYPLGLPTAMRAMTGDLDVFGTVYLGTTGNGFIKGTAPETVSPEQLCGTEAG